jgi:uncharacterized protein YdeI (YjbR/CyaY-like superfamily)
MRSSFLLFGLQDIFELKRLINIVHTLNVNGKAKKTDQKMNNMMEKGNHIEGVPQELQKLLDNDKKAQDFFNTLSKSYKKGYCDWVGSAKQEATRQTRAEKAILMLRNNQKTLKTV